MTFTELAVLEAMNMTQPPSREHAAGFAPVTAQEITHWIRHEAYHYAYMEGFRWKPTRGQVIHVLIRLQGLGGGSVTRARRVEDPLVLVYKGSPNRYGLSQAGLKAMCR